MGILCGFCLRKFWVQDECRTEDSLLFCHQLLYLIMYKYSSTYCAVYSPN